MISSCPLGKSYWAKDIIFLVTTGEDLGTQAWIDSYMGDHTTGTENKDNLQKVNQGNKVKRSLQDLVEPNGFLVLT